MITLKNITKSFKDKQVFDAVNLSLGPNDVVGLIGKNGVGKTTLMKMILGEVEPDDGTINIGNETVGYLPQQFDFGRMTVGEFLESKLPNEYLAWKIDANLEKVGLKNIPLSQNAASLSGGQKTRLGLAALLLSDPEPTVLLLDEPTNNLDLQGLEWLKEFLRQFNGSVLLTSHDRAFLDDTVTRIIELDGGKTKNYGGNYTFYHQQKMLERESQQEWYENNQEERKRLKHAIVAQKERGRHAHSHMKNQTDHDTNQRNFFKNRVTVKIGQQAKALKTRLEQMEKVERPVDRKRYEVSIESAIEPHKLLFTAEGLTKKFNGRPVLHDITFTVRGNERIWLSGVNGSGKSTLLKIVAQKLSPDSGKVRIGANVQLGYFSQELSDLDLGRSGLDELLLTGAQMQNCYRQARSLYLAESDLKKPLFELSRGQQAKVALAKLLLQKNQLLVLDEPTNHLEIDTREDIEEALGAFRGAILVASHDRYFLEAIKITKEFALDGRAN